MSQFQYNSLMSSLLNQKCTLSKLKAELERRKERMCWCCKKFGYLAHNCRNRNQKKKRKLVSQNRFEVLASKVMRYSVREGVEVRRQEVVEGVQYFRYRGIGYYK